MRRILVSLVLAALPSTALAQEYRPTLAIVGIQSEADLASAAAAAGRSLATKAEAGGAFSEVLAPDEVRGRLGPQAHDELLKCGLNADCVLKNAEKLEADRLVFGSLSSSGISYEVRVNHVNVVGARAGAEQLVEAMPTEDGVNQAVTEAADKMLAGAAEPMGLLVASTDAQTGTILVDGKAIGAPPQVERRVAAGAYTLKIEAPGVPPVEEQFTVVAGDRSVVALRTGAQSETPVAEAGAARGGSSSFFARPGTWIAAGGVVLVGVGAGFGLSAQSIDDKAVDADDDGALDITRAEAQDAVSSATTANVFYGIGAAAIAGGLTWALLSGGDDGPAEPKGPAEGPGPDVQVTPAVDVTAPGTGPGPEITPAPAPEAAPAPAPATGGGTTPSASRGRRSPSLAVGPFGLGLQAYGTF